MTLPPHRQTPLLRSPDRRIMDRRTMLATTGLGGLGLVSALSGCGTPPDPRAKETPGPAATKPAEPTPTPTPNPVELEPSITDGTTDVAVDTRVTVKARNGTVQQVSLAHQGKDRDGKEQTFTVDGRLTEDGSEWRASTLLDPEATYTLAMTGTNAGGTETSTRTKFTTKALTLDEQIFPSLYPLDQMTLGIGAPVILNFDLPVKDRKSFEKNLHVTSEPSQPGSWHWYSDTEVHFRPKNYWRKGSKVTVTANLNGVNAGSGRYGQEAATASFTIGRAVVTKINIKKMQARVWIDSKLARTIPVSCGKPGFTTRSGIKVISQKLRHTEMASETIGINEGDPEYYDMDVEYAMRITNSGEFLHAAPWNSGLFGVRNGSHGCIGMSTADARWLFENVR
ncbi:MAG: Ig-like domain-containing protein, partial [Propionibacteriaceae bacterium]